MTRTYLIEVSRRHPEDDPAGQRLLAGAGPDVEAVRLAWLYELEPVDGQQAERIAAELLVDAALDEVHIEPGPSDSGATRLRESESVFTVIRQDGVMDPVALSTVVAARELGVELTGVRTAHRFYCRGRQGPPAPESLSGLRSSLHNPVVDRVLEGATPLPTRASGRAPETLRRDVPLEGLDDDALVQLSRQRTLALDAVEMRTVQEHFAGLGRAPSELELETIAQTWSEHCKHKTLTGPIDYVEHSPDGEETERQRIENLLKSTVFAATAKLDAERCWSVFTDNAGVVRFDDELGVAVKVETHNHPSAIEPYGGAGTGIGGVIRDILGTGLGARPIFNVDVFCVGELDARPEDLPEGSIHPKHLLEGVVAGVRDYGNRMGIPTIAGALLSEPRYVGNPLVYAGTVGLIPKQFVGKRAQPGDWVIAVGGRTGRDGIHGATFSSDALHTESETQSGGAVQIGNPIEEKMFLDVLLDVRDKGWLSALTDCGAGGFSSAIGEMAEEVGARVDMARAPLKYAGLEPWEVWISEAQERMVLAVPAEHGPAVVAAFAAEDVEATHLGEFTGDGRLVVTWGDEVVGDLDLGFLHDGLPKQVRKATWKRQADAPFVWPEGTSARSVLDGILARPTVCSKEWIVRQYDHEVQGASALKNLVGAQSDGPSDAACVAPVPGSPRGVLVGLGLNPRHGDIDPYQMALGGVDEALRNLVAAGGDPSEAAVLDNFSWGDCRRPEQLGSIVRAAQGCHDAALAYGVPFISGKDSLNNEYELEDGTRVAIPGTLLITGVTVVDDVSGLVSMDLKAAGNPVLVVGETRAELGGSMAAEVLKVSGGAGPRVELARAPAVLRAVHAAIQTGAVRACHDLAEGGLAVAAAEAAFAGDVGLRLDPSLAPGCADLDPLTALFSETPTRFLLEVDAARLAEVEAALEGTSSAKVGETLAEPRLVLGDVLDAELSALKATWRQPLFDLYG